MALMKRHCSGGEKREFLSFGQSPVESVSVRVERETDDLMNNQDHYGKQAREILQDNNVY